MHERKHGIGISATELQALVEASMEGKTGVLSGQGGIEGLLAALGTSAEAGIEASEESIEARQKLFGSNKVEQRRVPSIWELVGNAFNDATLWILTGSGVLSLVLGSTFEEEAGGGWLEGASILGAVGIIVCVTAATNFQKEQQFAALNEESDSAMAVRVVRSGKEVALPSRSLVVGDVVFVEAGDIVPADGFLLSGSGLRLDESNLTGESEDVVRGPGDALLSGSKVLEGQGEAAIVAVGSRSQQGTITSLVRENKEESDQTVLQAKLSRLAERIGFFGFVAGVTCTLGAAAKYTYMEFAVEGADWDISYLAQYVKFLINGTAIIVVAVPEGLPLAVTLSLAVAVKRMLADSNLVRSCIALHTPLETLIADT